MITLVAAVAQNNCIGKNGGIPWRIPEDWRRMQALTLGKVLIMGRRTWESIPESRRPLPGRTNVVITRAPRAQFPPGVEVYITINEAIAAHPHEAIIGFGGQKIYEEMLPLAEVLEITRVHQTVDAGDAFFPPIDRTVWQETWREDHQGFAFVKYEKRTINKEQ
ncbi:MAG: dihydrofolate reductase [Candidatus Magasanikbacteria bacterium]|nr:dihydrofolate reductase [Candidatus Magasanikbacteria bacterium]